MVLVVGQACNYKCKMCANFAPISPNAFKRYDVKDIKKTLDTLLLNVQSIEELQIQGGEPFLYRDLGEILNYLNIHRDIVKDIVIATNGSIIPDDSIIKLIRSNAISVRISDYGITLERTQALIKKLNDNGIKNWVYSFTNGKGNWYDCGGVNTFREVDLRIFKYQFKTCKFNTCLTLERGEISHCSRATNSYILQKFDRKRTDYVDLNSGKGLLLRIKLSKYIYLDHYMTACAYCYGTKEERLIEAAEQL